jgi:hypothetical protein
MGKRQYILWIVPVIGLYLAFCTGFHVSRSEGNVKAAIEQDKEIVVTIGESDRSVIAEGVSLRKTFKFREAIAAYQKLLDTQGIPVSLRAEAE